MGDDLDVAATSPDFVGDDAEAQRDSLRIATGEQPVGHVVIAVQDAERGAAADDGSGAHHRYQSGHADAVGDGGVETFDVVESQPFGLLLVFGVVPLFDELPERLIGRASLAHMSDNGLPLWPEVRFLERAVELLPVVVSDFNGGQPGRLHHVPDFARLSVNEFGAQFDRRGKGRNIAGEYSTADPVTRFQYDRAEAAI